MTVTNQHQAKICSKYHYSLAHYMGTFDVSIYLQCLYSLRHDFAVIKNNSLQSLAMCPPPPASLLWSRVS